MDTKPGTPKSATKRPRQISLLRNIIQAAAEAIILFNKDGIILLVNPSCESMFGYAEDELIGREIELLVPDRLREMHRQERQHYNQNLHPRPMSAGLDLFGVRKDGSEFPVEVSLSYFEEAGTTYITAFVADITNRKHAESELQQTEKKFSRTFQSAPLAATITRLDTGQFSEVNRAFLELTGYKRSEVIGKTPVDIHIQPNWDTREKLVNRLKQDHSIKTEMRFSDKHGRMRIVLGAFEIIEINGEDHVLAFFNDITDRHTAETALRDSEARYRALFLSMEDAVCVVDYDTGQMIDFNEEALKRMARSREEMLAIDIMDIVPERLRATHPVIQKKLKPYKPVRFETIHICKAGDEIPVEVSAVLVKIGQTRLVYSMARDIRQRQEIQQALQRERDLLQTYLDVARVIFLIIGSDRKVKMINKYGLHLLGYSEEEVIGKDWFSQFIPARERKEVRRVQKSMMRKRSNDYDRFENAVITQSGEELIISWQNVPMMDENGKVIATLSSGIDVTEKRRYESDLMNAVVTGQEKERQRLAEELHDGLGPLLSSVKNNLEAIESLIRSTKDRKVQYFENSKWLLQQAIQETREIAHNLMPKTLEEFGLASALHGLTELLSDTQAVQIDYYTNITGKLGEQGIEFSLYRIAQELLNNALKHSNATKINLQLILHTDSVVLTIDDNGEGFNPEESTTTHKGLGLRNISSRLRAIKGHILLDSAPGQGTVVTVEVPILVGREVTQ